MTNRTDSVIQFLRRAVQRHEAVELTDGQLLDGFVTRQDVTALEALVRRHGPMVWGVCRRTLSDYHDAEDAFQATFLVLARKASSIVPREMVANWLYGVARRTALKARATIAKTKGRERQVREMPEPAVPEPRLWNDLQPLLDEELSRLPDNYRVLVVLCDLEGKSRKDVAGQLRCPEGTVAGRLARARAMLANRLAQRGILLSSVAMATMLSRNVLSASVPTSVVSSTIKAASLFAAGQALATGVISAQVAALTEGVLKTMLLMKLKVALVVMLMLGMISSGVGLLTLHSVAAQPNPSPSVESKPVSRQAASSKRDASLGQIKIGRGPRDYTAVFTKTLDVMGDSFVIDYANRFDGRIEGSATATGKNLPAVTRRGVALIQACEEGGFTISLRIDKERAEGTKWKPVGRDSQPERAILKRLKAKAADESREAKIKCLKKEVEELRKKVEELERTAEKKSS